jgi:hypothetical protein
MSHSTLEKKSLKENNMVAQLKWNWPAKIFPKSLVWTFREGKKLKKWHEPKLDYFKAFTSTIVLTKHFVYFFDNADIKDNNFNYKLLWHPYFPNVPKMKI